MNAMSTVTAYDPFPFPDSHTGHSAMFSKILKRARNVSGPLAHLLTSNDPPSDVEETLTRNKIQAMRGDITSIQLEIDNDSSRHPERVTTLEDRKTTIIKSVDAHESILSPLRKLPPELLQLIFQKAHWSSITTFALPWYLSQVCRSWRTVVHSTPILWSCITIDFSTKSIRLPFQEARLKLVLQRSCNVDLQISVCGPLKKRDERLSLLSILVAHSERWKYLNLELTMTTETIMALQAAKGHLQRLSRLRLKFWRPKPMSIDIFSIAPRLESVAIDNDLNTVRVDLPLPRLRSYISKTFAGGGEEITLDAFSNLECLGTGWERAIGPLEPCITFARLKILLVFFRRANAADGFFEHLILPSINQLHVWGHGGVVLSLSSTISRSLPCNLHTLSIGTATFENPGDLTSLLLLTPQLVDLRIPLPPLLDISNLFATATTESPVLLPNLNRLILTLPSPLPFWFFLSLSTLIARRCEIPPNTRALFPGGFSTLKFLKLKFSTRAACRIGYLAIQLFPPAGDLDIDVLNLIDLWKKRLLEEIPQISGSATPRKMFINLMYWRRLDQLFNTIEGYNIPKSGYLHVSKLHFVMYALDQSDPSTIPGEKRYHFRSRAKALLDRWKPLLLQDVHYYQWLNTDTDPESLTYVPKQAELRKTSAAIDLIYSSARMYKFHK